MLQPRPRLQRSERSNVYVADECTGRVDIFEPIIVPTLTPLPVTNPNPTSGELTAEVDPAGGGPVTGCQFEYGLESGNYSIGQLPCLDSEDHEIGTVTHPIEATTKVHADLAGLAAETTYHYRLIAVDAQGANTGPDHEYTPHRVAGLETGGSANVTATSATLSGSFIGNGEATKYHFEWGMEGSFDRTTALANAGRRLGQDELA